MSIIYISKPFTRCISVVKDISISDESSGVYERVQGTVSERELGSLLVLRQRKKKASLSKCIIFWSTCTVVFHTWKNKGRINGALLEMLKVGTTTYLSIR